MQGPRFPEAPRRLPESWRVNLEPLTGSPIFSHIFTIRTRGCFQILKNSIRERRSLAPLRRRLSNSVRPLLSLSKSVRPLLSIKQLIRNSHPQSDAPRAIQRMSPPRTVGMMANRRFCVNCRDRPPSETAPLGPSGIWALSAKAQTHYSPPPDKGVF